MHVNMIIAMKFVKDIRKQGVFDGNKTCLDQFRVLITEIGMYIYTIWVSVYAMMCMCNVQEMRLGMFEWFDLPLCTIVQKL